MTHSKLSTSRQSGNHQVEAQRARILDVAQTLFLQQGLEHTSMVDIAAAAGITKVTLYRYFPNRDEIAVEIRSRMLQRIAALREPATLPMSLEGAKMLAQSAIRNFDALRDVYRFMAMFDTLYLDHAPDAAVTQWTKRAIGGLAAPDTVIPTDPEEQRCFVILSSVIWFLEKVAVRGEVLIGAPDVSLTEHLQIFEEMVMVYIEHLLAAR